MTALCTHPAHERKQEPGRETCNVCGQATRLWPSTRAPGERLEPAPFVLEEEPADFQLFEGDDAA